MGPSKAGVSRYRPGLSFPSCRVRASSWPPWCPDSAKAAQGRCPHAKTPLGECSRGSCESGLPPPLPTPLPLPLPCSPAPAPAPPPPPVCDGGRAAGRAKSSGAELTLPPDPIQARRGERPALCSQGPQRPRTLSGFRGQGWEVAATTLNPGQSRARSA